jgi:hypothetical protein
LLRLLTQHLLGLAELFTVKLVVIDQGFPEVPLRPNFARDFFL